MSTQAYANFERTLDRANALLEAHRDITRQKRGKPYAWASDVLRAALVFIMASMDSYLHDVIHENAYPLIKKLRGNGIPKSLLKALEEAVPYEKVFEVWHEEKPAIKISTALRKRNAARTFMKPDKAEEALKMLGIDDVWKTAAHALHKRRKEGFKRLFENYADRSDNIVHEGDVGKATRSKGKLKSIRRPYVEKAMTDIQKLVQIVDRIVSRKLVP